ncbi:hypothetical protein FJV83_29675 [Mesorhizobium sp. WSM4307]|uniref:hypothetical protein n=1 Tax=unclassified Mesorhizobium TaxID=325217 RepID=UPI00115EF5D8|nr:MULTISPECIES: hypothetical protein [unclassified Mesorhizobium]TRC77974.1 hypothetical protein FJV81_10225 [Mesorhizobium sp. WSM4315]TRC78629.1 hypothetical protein FJV83_29675 [Mesorhizobium sp. WSM4307]TRC80256.1 hypothetical protein FJV80_23195 [Mesorhizobium sp. WSM4310]
MNGETLYLFVRFSGWKTASTCRQIALGGNQLPEEFADIVHQQVRGLGAFADALSPAHGDGQLVAPLPTVLKGPDWYFALIREGDQRPAPRSFSNWLRAKIQRSHWQD